MGLYEKAIIYHPMQWMQPTCKRRLHKKSNEKMAVKILSISGVSLSSWYFVHFAKSRGCKSPSDLASLIQNEYFYSTFPNVSIALRMFRTISLMISNNCSGERSFSLIALVINKIKQHCGIIMSGAFVRIGAFQYSK